MPIVKPPKSKQPLWKDSDQRSKKAGLHSTVYGVNGDQYTGEWKENKKNGMLQF